MDHYYDALGDGRFAPTELTRGPWSADHQHAGPPSALLGHLLAQAEGGQDKRVGRFTAEILRPVPMQPFCVETSVLRPGRRVDLVEARAEDDDGPILLARAWRVRRGELADLPALVAPPEPPAGPDAGDETAFFPVPWDVGYHTSLDYRFVAGAFTELGPATVWFRMRTALLPDVAPTPLQRVLVAADSGNGISASLDFARYLFVNADLTVHLHHEPSGEWVGMASRTIVSPDGIGLAETDLFDVTNAIGRSEQLLYVEERDRH